MPESAKPQFHAFYSNSYEALREALVAVCRAERDAMKAASGDASWFFRRIPVIVPSSAVSADLARAFADRSAVGVSSAVDFKPIGEWFTPVSGTPLGNSSRASELEWLIWAKLLDEGFLRKKTSESLRRYLSLPDGSPKPASDASRFELARRIAAAFTKYSTYRFDWVYSWFTGGEPLGRTDSERARREAAAFAEQEGTAAWQRDLWRWFAEAPRGRQHRWRGINDLAELADRMLRPGVLGARPLDSGAALHVFAPSGLPPLVLPFLYEKSLRDPVYLYLLNPSESFWFSPEDWRIARRRFGGGDEAPGDAGSCPWLRRNAGQTRALIDRVWRFTTAESPENVEDDAEGTDGGVPKPVSRPFAPDDAIQDFKVSLEDPDTVIPVDPAALAGHGTGEAASKRTMLDAVHEAVFLNRARFLEDPDWTADHEREAALYREPEAGLPSVRIASAPTLRREAEGLADWIYALRAEGVKASEILVVTPDLAKAAPVIGAVFSALPERIDFTVSGRSLEDLSEAARAFRLLGEFLSGRAEAEAFADLISSPAVAKNWGFSGDDAETIAGWLAAAGYRRGLSERHLENALAAGIASDEGEGKESEATLARAIERLALGAAADPGVGRNAFWADVRPVTGEGWNTVSSRPDLFGRLMRFAEELERGSALIFDRDREGGALPGEWREELLSLLRRFFPENRGWWAAPDAEELAGRISKLCATAQRAFEGAGLGGRRVPFRVLWKALSVNIEESGRAPRPEGRVIVTSMDGMRGIPFRAIACVGLDSDSGFPGTTRLEEFDLMGVEALKRRGDRDSRRDNRNIFFDLVAAAREWFAVFYAAGPNREKQMPPSEVVSDFDEFLCEIEDAKGTEGARAWRLALPQTSFSRRNFTESAAARHALGASKAAFEALSAADKSGLPEASPFVRGGEELGAEFRESRTVPLEALAACFRDPEKFAARLGGFGTREAPSEDNDRKKKKETLGLDASPLGKWARKSEAMASHEAGMSAEAFAAVRSLDPTYGAKALREPQILAEAAPLFEALDEAGDIGPVPATELLSVSANGRDGAPWQITARVPREDESLRTEVAVSGSGAWRALLFSLFLSAARPGSLVSFLQLQDAEDKEAGDPAKPVPTGCSPDEAKEALKGFLGLFELALSGRPLPSRYGESAFYRGRDEEKAVLKKAVEGLRDGLKQFLVAGGRAALGDEDGKAEELEEKAETAKGVLLKRIAEYAEKLEGNGEGRED